MNTTQTLEQMKQLRLQGMYHAYQSQLELPMDQQLEGHDLVAQLVQSEHLNRNNEKTAYYLKLAKLRLPATVEQRKANGPEWIGQFGDRQVGVHGLSLHMHIRPTVEKEAKAGHRVFCRNW